MHHAVCAISPIIVRLLNYCHATLAIILLSPSVSVIVHNHSVEIIYFLKFITLRLIIDHGATPTFTQTK